MHISTPLLSRATLKVCQHIVVVVNSKSTLDTHVLKTTKSFKMVRTDVCICTWILSDRFFTLFLYVWWVDGLDDIWITFNETNLTNPSKTSSKKQMNSANPATEESQGTKGGADRLARSSSRGRRTRFRCRTHLRLVQ